MSPSNYSSNSGFREPAVVTGNGTQYDAESGNKHGFGAGTAGANAFLAQLKEDFTKMAKSVAIYGGFYISRYEIGEHDTSYTSKKGQTVLSANRGFPANTEMWYGLYNHTKGTIGGTISHMLWRKSI